MLDHPALEIVGHASVQVSRPAGQDVNPMRAAHLEISAADSRSLTPVRRRRTTGFGMTAKAYAPRWSGGPAIGFLSVRLPRMILRCRVSHPYVSSRTRPRFVGTAVRDLLFNASSVQATLNPRHASPSPITVCRKNDLGGEQTQPMWGTRRTATLGCRFVGCSNLQDSQQ